MSENYSGDDDTSIFDTAKTVSKSIARKMGAEHEAADLIGNLFGTYAVTDKIALYGRIENLLDDQNEPVIGYGRIGRAAYGGVRVGL